jgi:hypothetical protein
MKYSIITDLFNRFFNSKNNENHATKIDVSRLIDVTAVVF